MMHKNNNNNLVTPYFISNGGYFPNEGEIIGVTEDDSIVYIPDTLTILSESEFVDYIKTLSLKNEEGIELSLEEKEQLANDWLDENYN